MFELSSSDRSYLSSLSKSEQRRLSAYMSVHNISRWSSLSSLNLLARDSCFGWYETVGDMAYAYYELRGELSGLDDRVISHIDWDGVGKDLSKDFLCSGGHYFFNP